MSYPRYLAAVNTALRETILPEVQSGRARDAVSLSISVLGALAASLEAVSPDILSSLDIKALPEALKALVPIAETPKSEIDPGVSPPLSGPANDFALNRPALPLLKAGAEWLAGQPWQDDASLRQSANALLNWETALRQDTLRRVRSVERGLPAESASAAVPDINAPALEAYLRQRLDSNELRVTDFRFLTGGRSRQTALFKVAGTSAIPERLVVQREHPGAITTLSGTHMQYRAMELAHARGVKVPRPVMLELSPLALGAAFMIAEQVPGATPMPSMDYWSPPLKSDKLATSLAEQLALIHRIPVGPLEPVMARYVDPEKGQSWPREVDEIEQQLKDLAHGPSMAVSAGVAWMRAHASCVDAAETIVHNDTLLHNLLVENDEITAVLDWEMAHIGHPFEDLGNVRPVVEQMTDWSLFLDAYVAAGGRRPTQEQTDFFTLRAMLKLLVQTMHARAAFDTRRTNDLTMAEVGASFTPNLINRVATQITNILHL